MLYLIGLGLYDESDITLKGIKYAKECDKVYCELYTSFLPSLDIKSLSSLIDKEIILLSRRDLEEEGEKILNRAKENKIAIFIPGDPLIATTHSWLRLRAKEMDIETRIIHAPSIYSAAPSIVGLQHYKFGRSTTLVFPEEKYFPKSPYYTIKENKDRGLHTLVLLDIKDNRMMHAKEAIDLLIKMEEQVKEGLIKEDTLGIVLAEVGSLNPKITIDFIPNLKGCDVGKKPHSIIIPGDLHFMEKEALKKLWNAPINL